MVTGSSVIGDSSTKLVASSTVSGSGHSRRSTTPTAEQSTTTAVSGTSQPTGYGKSPRTQATLIYQSDDVFRDDDSSKKTKAGDLFEKIALERETYFWSLKHNDSAAAAAKEVTDDQEITEKLIIFDLDEHPPNYYQTNRNTLTQGNHSI